MASGIRIGLDEVMVHLSELEGPRSEVNLRHPLESVVVLALTAVLSDRDHQVGHNDVQS